MDLDWFISFWNQISSFWKIISLYVLSSVLLFVIYAFFLEIKEFFVKLINVIKKFFTRINGKKEEEVDEFVYNKEEYLKTVRNSDLFREIINVKTDVDNINFGSHNKNRIFKEIMYIYVDNIKNNIEDFINMNDKLNDISKEDFKTSIIMLSNKINVDTNKDFKNYLGEKLYNYVILHPINGFRKWEERSIVHENKLIKETDLDKYSHDKYIHRNDKRFDSYLDTKWVTLSILSFDYGKRFNNFNGEMDKILKENDN